MTRRWVVVALAASAVLLTGCTVPPSLPPPISASELAALIEQRNVDRWTAQFPDEPRPEVVALGYVDSFGPSSPFSTCLLDSGVEGVRVDGGNITFTPDDSADYGDYERAHYICSLQFPRKITDPELEGLLSRAQVDYLYDFFERRLVPCLALLGYTVPPIPDRDAFLDPGSPPWNPYGALTPQPANEAQWDAVGSRCPRPPYLTETYWPVYVEREQG